MNDEEMSNRKRGKEWEEIRNELMRGEKGENDGKGKRKEWEMRREGVAKEWRHERNVKGKEKDEESKMREKQERY